MAKRKSQTRTRQSSYKQCPVCYDELPMKDMRLHLRRGHGMNSGQIMDFMRDMMVLGVGFGMTNMMFSQIGSMNPGNG